MNQNQNQSHNLSNLPNSNDKAFWNPTGEKSEGIPGADVNLIDMATRKDLLCGSDPGDHDFKIDFQLREVNCNRCGLGFKFQLHEVEYTNGHLLLKSNKKRIA